MTYAEGWFADKVKAQATEIERLRAALKPFAKISLWRDSYPDAKGDFLTARQMQGYINVQDVRAARAALGDVQQTAGETK